MKEENLSTIKRYPITAYLESKGITPVRRPTTYAMYRSPLRDEHHPSFKVDTEKNLWIDYTEGCGGSIIDLYVRLEECTLPETIRCLAQMIFGHTTSDYPRTEFQRHSSKRTDGGRKLIGISDDLPPHLQDYLTKRPRSGTAPPPMRPLRSEGTDVRSHRLSQHLRRLRTTGRQVIQRNAGSEGHYTNLSRRAESSLPLRRLHGLPFLPFNERKGR